MEDKSLATLRTMVFLFGMDIVKSLRLIVEQNQTGKPLPPERIGEITAQAEVDFLPRIASASGTSAETLREALKR